MLRGNSIFPRDIAQFDLFQYLGPFLGSEFGLVIMADRN